MIASLLRPFGSLLAVAAFAVVAAAQCSQLPNAVTGTDLALTDESVRTVSLPFVFPFHGIGYDRITVASNGFLWLGDGALSDFSPTEAEALAQGPRIMPVWWDLDPGVGGQVTFAAAAGQVSICWKGVPQFGSSTVFANFECVLAASGAIVFRYGAGNGQPTVSTITGITRGNGVLPNLRTWPADILAGATIANATGMQINAVNAPLPLQTGGWLQLVPAGPTAYVATGAALPTCAPTTFPPRVTATTTAYGTGCPAAQPGGAIYQAFTTNAGAVPLDLSSRSLLFVRAGGSYTMVPGSGLDPAYSVLGTPLPMGDDTLQADLSVGPMGVFPFGTAAVARLSLCSNGFLWLAPNASTDFSSSVGELLGQSPRLAPFWTDLSFDPTSGSGGGALFWENGNPAFCRATWQNVVEYGSAGSANTFQVTLFANGDFQFSYAAMSGGLTHSPLVGVSGGAVVPDPLTFDLVSGPNVNVLTRPISGVVPMTLTTTTCLLGAPFTMTASVPGPLLGYGAFAVGVTQSNPGVDLGFLGAAGCRAYTTLDILYIVFFSGSPMTTSVPVPYDVTFLGAILFAQAASGTPANAFGFFTSNGVSFAIGNSL